MHEVDDHTVIRSSHAAPALVEPDLDDTIVRAATSSTPPPAVRMSASVPAPRRFHSFVLGDSVPVPLDRPCTVGRSPSASRVPAGLAPRLVRVPSPNKEVSGSHVEMRQVGATVVVTDLRSTNGTVVRLPGQQPRRLRQSESLVVVAGTAIDLGDGNVLTVLAPGAPA